MIDTITGYLSTVDQVTGGVILSVPGPKGEKGEKGDQGIQGVKGDTGATGSSASVTSANITAALGFTPDNPTATRTPSAHTHPLSQITQSAATSGQVATWNGTAWIPSTPAAAVVTSVAGKTGAVTLASSDITGLQTALDGKQIAGSYATATQGVKADSALQPGTAISNVLGLQTALDGKQAIGTYATLVGGTVPSSQLPSYVDDVLEFATLAAFPVTGETGKIYVSTGSNKTYRWSGSAYVEIAASPGSTDAITEGSANLYFTAARAVSALASTLTSYATQAWVTAQSYATTSGVSSSISSAISALGLGTASTKSIDDFAPASGISPTAITGTAVITTDSRMSDARTPTAHTHTKSQITDFPTLATVATSGSYDDLSSKPTIPAATTNASLLTSGTLADARLSSNVPLLNATTNTFTGTQSAPTINIPYTGNDSSSNLLKLNGDVSWFDSTGTTRYGTFSRDYSMSVVNFVNTTNANTNLYTAISLYDNGNAKLGSYYTSNGLTVNSSGNCNITAAANTSALTASYSVTGANTTPLLNLTGTWNTTGVATGLKLNITDTASNASSLLMDLQVGGTSAFKVDKLGKTFIYGPSGTGVNLTIQQGASQLFYVDGNNGASIRSAGSYSWGVDGTKDLFLARDAANTLALRNGTNAQTFRLYNTYTDASNYERGFMRWNSNTLEIGAEAGGTGTQRQLSFPLGTVTASTPMLISQTWNNTATTFTGLRLNVTDTSSGASSNLLEIQRNGSSSFTVSKFGNLSCYQITTNGSQFSCGSVNVTSASIVSWNYDVGIGRNSAGVAEINSNTTGTFRDLKLRNLIQASGVATTVTPSANGDLVIEQTSNSSITFKMKGTDGTVRSATLALV